MRAGCGWSGFLLGLSLTACGRVGVELLPTQATPSDPDASVQAPLLEPDGSADESPEITLLEIDSGNHDDAGERSEAEIPQNIPVDAGIADASPHDGGAGFDPGSADASDGDAGSTGSASDAAADAGTSPCAGQSLFGLCWYLGAASASCDSACATHGGFDTRATSYVGTESQGGSLEACTQILTALGRPGAVSDGMRADDHGFGCHVWIDDASWWLWRNPDFRPSVSGDGVRIACGCLR